MDSICEGVLVIETRLVKSRASALLNMEEVCQKGVMIDKIQLIKVMEAHLRTPIQAEWLSRISVIKTRSN